MTKVQESERTEAISKLREMLRPGDILYTVVRHVSSSAKTKRELDREIKEILEAQAARSGLSRHHRYLLSQRKPSGALGAGYLTPAGWHGDPLTIEDPKLRLAALREQPAPRLPKGRQ